MPRKNIYVKNQDVELWNQAEERYGESLSSLITNVLKGQVNEPEEFNMKQLNENILIKSKHHHSKASEEYVSVVFNYPNEKVTWEGWVPTVYRRTNIEAVTPEDVYELLIKTYNLMHPGNKEQWLSEQEEFWKTKNAEVTAEFFNILKDGDWKCVSCDLPSNPNWARRVQDLKEMGYTIATNTKHKCKKCGENKTHLQMLHIPRGGQTGYEVWSSELRKRIMKTLGYFDVYEDRINRNSLLPDHKFSEIRWDENTLEENPNDMSETQILQKFQLLTNQRNQQKREACRNCYQTGKRGYPFGIKYYYQGTEEWDNSIPKRGKEAEKGCVGCGWYDLASWKNALNKSHEN